MNPTYQEEKLPAEFVPGILPENLAHNYNRKKLWKFQQDLLV